MIKEFLAWEMNSIHWIFIVTVSCLVIHFLAGIARALEGINRKLEK